MTRRFRLIKRLYLIALVAALSASAPAQRIPTDHYSYQITVVTQDGANAGTQDQVSIKVWGTEGESDWFVLNGPDSPSLDRSSVRRFRHAATEKGVGYWGLPVKIQLRLDGDDDWGCSFVQIVTWEDRWDVHKGQFIAGRYLGGGRNKKTGDLVEELLKGKPPAQYLDILRKKWPNAPFPASPGPLIYKVYVETRYDSSAETDDDVHIRIVGETGDSGWVELDNPGNDFEPGQKDEFTLSGIPDFGRISAVRLRLTAQESTEFDDWGYAGVTVEMWAGEKFLRRAKFTSKGWLGDNDGGGKTSVEFVNTDN